MHEYGYADIMISTITGVVHQINSFYRYGERAQCGKWFNNLKWCAVNSLKTGEKRMVRLKMVADRMA